MLVFDDYAAHKTASVAKCLSKIKVTPLLIPGGNTYCAQPLDVTINKPFKSALRREHNNFMENSNRFNSKTGIKCKPTWQETVDMVDRATKTLKPSMILNLVKFWVNFLSQQQS